MMRFNERADMAAKEALRLDNKIVNGSTTLASCKRLVAKYIYISDKPDGNDLPLEELHALISPTVGRSVQFPHVRSCAVSYIRLLLDWAV